MLLLLRQFVVHFRHGDQLFNLENHTSNIGGDWVVDCSHSLVQTEGLEDAIDTLGHTNAGADEGDFEVLHHGSILVG